MTWELVQPSPTGVCAAESHLEYSSEGAYDAIHRKVRILVGPHSGSQDGGKCSPENVVLFEYDEAKNWWSIAKNENDFPGIGKGHGYDHTSIDPSNGDTYVRGYYINRYYKIDGATEAVTEIAPNNFQPGEPAVGTTWDPNRGGIISFDDTGGVTFWSKTKNSWSQLVQPPSGMKSYHFWAGFHPPTGLVWLQDGNGSNRHWKLKSDNTLVEQVPAPITLGCCGGAGALSAYDSASKKFIVADPFANRWFEYDLSADSWRQFSNGLPLDQSKYDTSAVYGFVTPIQSYGVIMYVMGRGTGGTPKAYLYKHSN